MNISPISFGKLHIKNTEDNKDFLTMLCSNRATAPSKQFAIIDKASGNEDVYLQAQKIDSDYTQFDVKISNDKEEVLAWESFVPSTSRHAIKGLSEQVLKHYYDSIQDIESTPEELLDLYV